VLVLAAFLVTVTIAGALPMEIIFRRTGSDGKAPALKNPFQLSTALKFGVIYGIVLLAVEFAKRRFGAWGLMVAAVVSGLTDVDAITLARGGSLPADQAAGGIVLATLSNTVAKAAYGTWLG